MPRPTASDPRAVLLGLPLLPPPCRNSLYNMAAKSGTAFLFGVSFDMVQACKEKANYTW